MDVLRRPRYLLGLEGWPVLELRVVGVEAGAGVKVASPATVVMVQRREGFVEPGHGVLVPSILGVVVCPSLLGLEYKVNSCPPQIEKSTLQISLAWFSRFGKVCACGNCIPETAHHHRRQRPPNFVDEGHGRFLYW